MRTADGKRLINALIISIVFHVFILLGMNFLNWYSNDNVMDEYAPLIVKIENRIIENNTQDEIKVSENINESSINKVPEVKIQPMESDNSKTEISSVVSSSNTEFDPYADIGINNSSSNQIVEPEPPEEGIIKTPYIPTGKNVIELETPAEEDRSTNTQSIGISNVSSDEPVVPVLSESEFLGLESALNNDNIQSSSISLNQSESDSNLYEYRDVPVEFDNPGEQRKLITNPPPEIPDDLPPDFPPEITYSIRFSLNSDGFIQVLRISPPPLYPELNANIRKALRSWTFTESSGSEDVAGTITLIFKGK